MKAVANGFSFKEGVGVSFETVSRREEGCILHLTRRIKTSSQGGSGPMTALIDFQDEIQQSDRVQFTEYYSVDSAGAVAIPNNG